MRSFPSRLLVTLTMLLLCGCHCGLPPTPASGRDPAVERIDFNVVRRTDRFKALIRVTGVVRNIGDLPYESSPTQQSLHLYEDRRLVQTVAFQNLAPGQEIVIHYERDWDASSPAEGEFPPAYKVIIGYDPDILLDANPNNDDSVQNNNQKERSGSDLNGLIAAP
jgi:hypothetical protein